MNRHDAHRLVAGIWAEHIRPPRHWDIVDWAERHVRLDSELSAKRGPWRVRHSPYVREILEALSPDSGVQEVVIKKGSQLGMTLAAHLWLLFLIANHPSGIFALMPTLEDARDASKQKWTPLVNGCPEVKSRIAPERARNGSNTILLKSFPGGFLMMSGTNSPAKFRSRSGRYVMFDEVSAAPAEIRTGSPVELAKRFTRTFPNRKHLYISTPGVAGACEISDLYLRGDQSRFLVPCPLCAAQQVLIFQDKKTGRRGLQWKGTPPDLEAWYECEKCHGRIDEGAKGWMLENGVWRPQVPHLSELRRSFHLSSLYSPPGTFTWADIAAQWLGTDHGKNPAKLRLFINETLGEEWEEQGEAPEWENLFSRKEPYEIGTCPLGVGVITAGVDVQRDRIEIEFVGWGRRLESWSLDYVRIDGDTADARTWQQLDEQLARKFRRADGGAPLPVRLAAVDSGYDANRIYNYVRGKAPGTVVAVKGRGSLPTIVSGHPTYVDVRTRSGVLRRGAQLWTVGVHVVSQELYGFLRVRPIQKPGESPPLGLCHWPAAYPQDYFEQLTSHRRVPHRRNGFIYWEWESTGRDEVHDCRSYARAAAAIIRVDNWTERDWVRAIGGQSTVRTGTPPRSGAPRRGSSFGSLDLDQWRLRNPTSKP